MLMPVARQQETVGMVRPVPGVPALVASAPLIKLQRTRLQHLVGVKPRILTQQRMRERRDQCLRRMIEDEMAGNKARRSINLLLTVEGVEQRSADIPS
jgi:hypothetical protein